MGFIRVEGLKRHYIYTHIYIYIGFVYVLFGGVRKLGAPFWGFLDKDYCALGSNLPCSCNYWDYLGRCRFFFV